MTTDTTPPPATPAVDEVEATPADPSDLSFDPETIKRYPRANRKLNVGVAQYGLSAEPPTDGNGQTSFISPHGLEFKTSDSFVEGELLKIHIALPEYWNRKQRFVEYARIDTPDHFKILGKVVKTEDLGKRGKKKIVTVQTLVIDEVDEKVLKTFLQEG